MSANLSIRFSSLRSANSVAVMASGAIFKASATAQDLVALKRGPLARGPQGVPMRGRRHEDLLAQFVGRHVGDDLELRPIFQHLRQPPMRQRRHPFAHQLVDLRLEFAPGHPHAVTEDQEQAFGDLQPPGSLRGR